MTLSFFTCPVCNSHFYGTFYLPKSQRMMVGYLTPAFKVTFIDKRTGMALMTDGDQTVLCQQWHCCRGHRSQGKMKPPIGCDFIWPDHRDGRYFRPYRLPDEHYLSLLT